MWIVTSHIWEYIIHLKNDRQYRQALRLHENGISKVKKDIKIIKDTRNELLLVCNLIFVFNNLTLFFSTVRMLKQ